jgi:hypothetical protein
MRVQFKTVLGRRSRTPGVFAIADGERVRWSPRRGWECDCMFPEAPLCDHVAHVRGLLDASVFELREVLAS